MSPNENNSASVAPLQAPLPADEQVAHLIAKLRQLPDVDPTQIQIVRVPLRICPLGAHIDHQLGVVTGMTIDRAILLAFAPRNDGVIVLDSLNFDGPTTIALDNVPVYRQGDWANYVRGAVLALQAQHRLTRGFTGVIGGDMPIGGLSSSAAVTIAYLLALETVNGLDVAAQDNVEHCRYTENQYIGLQNGILDQSVILFSAPQHLTRIDCERVAIDRVESPLSAEELAQRFAILVVYSGVTHALVGTDYNNRVLECRSAAEQLLTLGGLAVPDDVRLRHVPPALYDEHGDRLDGAAARRARHYFGEMARVDAGVAAWAQGDLTTFGRLVTESGESSVTWYECGSPQLVSLYEILRETPGVYGTRFSGAGFRGNCIALIDPAQAEAIAAAVHEHYPARHPDFADRYSIHLCRPDGSPMIAPVHG